MDDIIIAGDESTHDGRLQKFPERASRKGVKLNKEKCRIRQEEVPYVGHLLTAEGLKIYSQKIKAIKEIPEPESNEDVLLQDNKHVCYASRALTGTETRYATIESEMFACCNNISTSMALVG